MSSLVSAEILERGQDPAQLLQPECMLPVQYNTLVRKRSAPDGERRLLAAVLKDAMRAFIMNMDGCRPRERRDFMEAYQWFHAKNQSGIFAYEAICEALGLEPEPLRRWLGALRKGAGRPGVRGLSVAR
jgi:hypothetical protein